MNKKVLDKVTFVGRPFPDSLIDEQKTFTQANMQIIPLESIKKAQTYFEW